MLITIRTVQNINQIITFNTIDNQYLKAIYLPGYFNIKPDELKGSLIRWYCIWGITTKISTYILLSGLIVPIFTK